MRHFKKNFAPIGPKISIHLPTLNNKYCEHVLSVKHQVFVNHLMSSIRLFAISSCGFSLNQLEQKY